MLEFENAPGDERLRRSEHVPAGNQYVLVVYIAKNLTY